MNKKLHKLSLNYQLLFYNKQPNPAHPQGGKVITGVYFKFEPRLGIAVCVYKNCLNVDVWIQLHMAAKCQTKIFPFNQLTPQSGLSAHLLFVEIIEF